MTRRNGHSLLTWQDLYYDGILDEKYEAFCEDTQEIFDYEQDDGWDDIEKAAIKMWKGKY